MKFFKQLNDQETEAQPPITQPVPMRPKTTKVPDDAKHLTDLDGVAHRLGMSKRHVQTLVQRRVIPVIKFGRRCTRFDLDDVLIAVEKFKRPALD